MVGFIVAGPKSRELLARLTDEDVSNAGFPFMDFRRMDLGMVPAWVGRINFTGDLGYELWVAPDDLRRLYDDLLTAGEDLEIGRAQSELQSLMRSSYAVFCLKKKNKIKHSMQQHED